MRYQTAPRPGGGVNPRPKRATGIEPATGAWKAPVLPTTPRPRARAIIGSTRGHLAGAGRGLCETHRPRDGSTGQGRSPTHWVDAVAFHLTTCACPHPGRGGD